ncbi:hypothetical protein AKJ51_03935 [candidate division MSBL1 archaeon SCGC-AAA382A20]|uniref:Ribonuclease n=1 Tax=candidate division MSBL1 archaeon SCGC-AAA382A20 TaxID=1698280 RepID=A0A133VIK9_9EURY|nr:hypothetical protein AKJ51_03935 [candidate division MSBL1 archaeon SCGC-AAA382A20]
MSDILIATVDEAGRGPVIGPLVICGVAFPKDKLDELSKAGVKDSKKLSPRRRGQLVGWIRGAPETVEITELTAQTVDRLRRNGVNMNRIETIEFATIPKKLVASAVYTDSVGPNSEKFADTLRSFLYTDIDLTVECKADENYLQVSAASILAKVKRDERVRELEEKHGEIGSGYPSDERTVRFLEKWVEDHAELPSFVRRSWRTANGLE